MTKTEILGKLCCYDVRNPDYVDVSDGEKERVTQYFNEVRKEKDRCYCDNCFYGRSTLANELLKYVI